MATDVARALAERVEVLERALQVRDNGEGPTMQHWGGEDGGGGGGGGGGNAGGVAEDEKGNADQAVQDGLRLQLRLVEAERDKAQRIVRDVRAYLLDEGSTLQL